MFTNEPLTDFTVATNRDAMTNAIAEFNAELQRAGPPSVTPVINGIRSQGGTSFVRTNPAQPGAVIATVRGATVDEAKSALAAARKAQPGWEEIPATERAQIMRTAAQKMREQRFSLSAVIIAESGKPWAEADADVAEAIDFLDYYAMEMERLEGRRSMSSLPGEENWYFYQPRGVCVVISPWNFPLAIACGMAAAALVTGNTCILKPAEQTSLIAARLFDLFIKAGVPPEVLHFLPGVGEEVGPELVSSPLTDMIAFTGSKAVGLSIISEAARTKPEQRSIKKVIAELGGKNCVIVDEDADLDDAVKGVLQSAFGYAGQKCSACSRVIVVGAAYETFVKRLTAAAADIIVGDPSDPATFLPPVVDHEAQARILSTIAAAKRTEKCVFEGNAPRSGCFVPATIFADVTPQAAIWKEEIFGPVLAIRQAKSFEAAVAEANDSAYALTGGVFSRSPKNLEYAQRRFKVGNLYLNRKITGALVHRQPFGGFKMSGVGSKAGGPDYLIQFMEPRAITENTMRRGFAPANSAE